MNKRGATVLGIQLEWVIIIVSIIFGTAAIVIIIKAMKSGWLQI